MRDILCATLLERYSVCNMHSFYFFATAMCTILCATWDIVQQVFPVHSTGVPPAGLPQRVIRSSFRMTQFHSQAATSSGAFWSCFSGSRMFCFFSALAGLDAKDFAEFIFP
jgi:hypothetical protein